MSIHFSELATRAVGAGAIDVDGIFALRRASWANGRIEPDEAEAIFALNQSVAPSAEWSDFFVEAISEFVLNAAPPRLQCNDEEAQWLIDQIDHDGVTESVVELETMVCIIERAENTPARLEDYVLGQVVREVLTGIGPTRCGGELGRIGHRLRERLARRHDRRRWQGGSSGKPADRSARIGSVRA
jgi:hypothetical protein